MLEKKQSYKDGIFVDTWLDETYTTRYWIIIIEDWDKLEESYKELIGGQGAWKPGEVQAAFTEDFVVDNHFNVMLVFQRATTYSVIAHECVHATNMTFQHHGMKLDLLNDEHQAYYVGYLVNKCHVAFDNEHTHRTKKNEKPPRKTNKRSKPKKAR